MILFIGQVGREFRDREAFREVDFRAMFASPLAKWAAEIHDATRALSVRSTLSKLRSSGLARLAKAN